MSLPVAAYAALFSFVPLKTGNGARALIFGFCTQRHFAACWAPKLVAEDIKACGIYVLTWSWLSS